MARSMFWITAIWLLSAVPARSQEVDKTGQTLEEAKSKYSAKEEEYKKGVMKRLDDAEDRAVRAGSKSKVDKIVAERKAFVVDGILPTVFITKDLDAKRRGAAKELESAYAKAIQEYTQKRNRTAADQAEQELTAFSKKQESTSPNPVTSLPTTPVENSPIKAGATFEGMRTNSLNGTKSLFAIRFETVRNGKFTGAVRFEGSRDYPMSGELVHNTLSFAVVGQNDQVNQTYNGSLKGDLLNLVYGGTAAKGGPLQGEVKATLKMAK